MARMPFRAAVPILAIGGVALVILLAIAVTSGVTDGLDAAVIERRALSGAQRAAGAAALGH